MNIRRNPLKEGKERRRGINLWQAINTALLAGIFLYVQNGEHRLTALETKVDIIMHYSGIEIPEYLRQPSTRSEQKETRDKAAKGR